nr:unnamed protein product [Callosobruchus analis]
MRPIVPSIQCPNGKLVLFLSDILASAYDTENEYYIKDSFTFSKFINNYQLPPGYVVVSFDVISLFTNLSLHLVINSITRHWDTISHCCTINLDTAIMILKFIFDSNFLKFEDNFYKQVFGTPMGSTIPPILVNYVLDDLIIESLQKTDFRVPFVKRYVDDLLLALPTDKIDILLNTFNSYDVNLQFTVEKEVDNGIPSLDMRIIRQYPSHDMV